jgi:hypothetical protein
MIMAQKDNTKQNNPISLNELPIQRIEDISKQIVAKSNNLFDELNKQFIDRMNKDREDAQYSKELVLQMRENKNNRLYKTPEDVNWINAGGYVWENGKVGYFIPFEHRTLGYDFIQPQFGGGQKDGKGLRFVQVHKDSSKMFAYPQSNDIIISSFGEYVLENWGKDLPELCQNYITGKYRKHVELWRKENYPNKMNKQTGLQILIDLKEAERDRWGKATIAEFLTADDNEKLNQCMNEYFNQFDNYIQIESNKEEKDLINFIKSGTVSNRWVNGKAGDFKDFDDNCLYRFCETDKELCHHLHEKQEQKNLPVLARGFVGWLIKHWENTPKDIFQGYYQAKSKQHKESHKNDLDSWKSDFDSRIEREFFDQYRAKEEQWVKQSKAIFDFISEPEVNKIKEYVRYYFEYVDAKITQQIADTEYNRDSNNNTDKPQYPLTLNVERVIKEQILPIWKSEVLENTPDDIFLKAIITADFSTYYVRDRMQKVGYFIYSLKQIMGEAWANDVISKLTNKNATLLNFQKRTIQQLKNVMKGIVIVNTTGNQFKIDTKTQYIDKTTNKPYYKATK